jgi:hypothetical protein
MFEAVRIAHCQGEILTSDCEAWLMLDDADGHVVGITRLLRDSSGYIYV